MRQLQNITACQQLSSASVLAKEIIAAKTSDEHHTKEITLSGQKFHHLATLTKSIKKITTAT